MGLQQSTIQTRRVQRQVADSLWRPEGLDDSAWRERVAAAQAEVESLEPADAFERMTAVQIVAAHAAALECLRRAMAAGLDPRDRGEDLYHAARLLAVHERLMSFFDRRRERRLALDAHSSKTLEGEEPKKVTLCFMTPHEHSVERALDWGWTPPADPAWMEGLWRDPNPDERTIDTFKRLAAHYPGLPTPGAPEPHGSPDE